MDNVQVYAVIENGTVSNLVLWDGTSEWQAPSGATAQIVPPGESVSIGYTFNGTTFTALASA